MSKKIPWCEIYKDFRNRHPRLKKDVVCWRPSDYLTITIDFSDGKKMEYDYLTHTGKFI